MINGTNQSSNLMVYKGILLILTQLYFVDINECETGACRCLCVNYVGGHTCLFESGEHCPQGKYIENTR